MIGQTVDARGNDAASSTVRRRMLGHFDEDFYIAQAQEAAAHEGGAFQHYLDIGSAAGHDPSPAFSNPGYLAAHPDVAAAGLDSFEHYIVTGETEGRLVIPSRPFRERPNLDLDLLHDQRRALLAEFDSDFYLRRYPSMEGELDTVVDYLLVGADAGRDPSPSFSTEGYFRAYPDVAKSGINPFYHFLIFGMTEGRRPLSSEFFTYLKEERLVDLLLPEDGECWILDVNYYLASVPDAENLLHPVEHFCTMGYRNNVDPHPLIFTRFMKAYYRLLDEDPTTLFDVLQGNAILNPLMARPIDGGRKDLSDHATLYAASSFCFDVEDYLEKNPDVRSFHDGHPIDHLFRYGLAENRLTNSGILDRRMLCSPRAPESVESASDRELLEGLKVPLPSQTSAAIDSVEMDRTAEEIAQHFDAEFYLSANPDVASGGMDPVWHYVATGWREGRDPSRSFSTRYYLESNPDVKAQGLNPFWHYIIAGKDENRLPVEPGGYKAQILKKLQPLEQTVDLWRNSNQDVTEIDRTSLVTALKRSVAPDQGRVIVSFTHDNYRKIVGGVQLCVVREEEAAAAAGYCYVALYPWQPLPQLAAPEDAPDILVNLVLNGEFLGTARMTEVTAAIAGLGGPDTACTLVIHSLLGHSPEAIGEMADRICPDDAWFWLHDNFSICPSYALQRNGITYCGAPEPTSQACGICVYGEERQRHLPRIREMFEKIDFTVVAPSQTQLSRWTKKSGLKAGRRIVLPHLLLDWSGAGRPIGDECGTPIKVAFAGVASAIKGWPVFEKLARTFAGSGGYEFYYFGVTETISPAVITRSVTVTSEEQTAMRDALMNEKIDLFLQWSSCPETFSFTTYEAMAAGAAIVTHPGTGNVAAIVKESGRGLILETEEALFEFFGSSKARSLAETNRRTAERGASLDYSRMTIDLIEG